MSYKNDLTKVDRTEESIGFPKVVVVDNCTLCNLKCSMCDHKNIRKYRKVEIMNWGLYKKIIDEVAIENPDTRVWEIFFGEPFLCKDMPKRVKYAKDKGLTDVVLNTNGVLMTYNRSKEIIESGLDAIYIGIDGITDDTYNQLRIGGNLEKVTENVINYKRLLDKIGNSNQKIYVQFIVSNINEHEVEEFKEFWVSKGIIVKIRPKISWSGLVNTKNQYDNNNVIRKPCYWLMQTMILCSDGRVALCGADVHCRVSCGDIKYSSIKEVWNDKLKEYRQMHKNGNFSLLPEMCYKCKDWQSSYAEFI